MPSLVDQFFRATGGNGGHVGHTRSSTIKIPAIRQTQRWQRNEALAGSGIEVTVKSVALSALRMPQITGGHGKVGEASATSESANASSTFYHYHACPRFKSHDHPSAKGQRMPHMTVSGRSSIVARKENADENCKQCRGYRETSDRRKSVKISMASPNCDLAFTLMGRVFGCAPFKITGLLTSIAIIEGGDIRSAADGSLIYSVHRRRAGQTCTIFLHNSDGRPMWKITERPGVRTSSTHIGTHGILLKAMRKIVPGKTIASSCGGAEWALRGILDRVSATTWAPRLSLRCKGNTIFMIGSQFIPCFLLKHGVDPSFSGDKCGKSYRFHDPITSRNTATFVLDNPPSVISGPTTPQNHFDFPSSAQAAVARAVRTAAPINNRPSMSVGIVEPFPERWELRIDTSILANPPSCKPDLAFSNKQTWSDVAAAMLPLEMFLAGGLVVQHFMRAERDPRSCRRGNEKLSKR
ncbi:hypothetical protein DFS34DRAFT_592456 [Phlyctochytrium arcticum]|nr:hypothetical protein DFS34DRAFT_592456 [Phlyctochytrium arcticum]